MPTSSDDSALPLVPPQQLRTLQIIAAALPAGVIVFMAITLKIVLGNAAPAPAPRGGTPIITLLAGLFLLVGLVLGALIPRVVTRKGLREILAGTWKPPQESPAGAYDTVVAKIMLLRQTSLIITLALAEAPAFFALIAFMIEQQWAAIGVAVFALTVMFVNFPTQYRVRTWLEAQARELGELRQLQDHRSKSP